MASGVSPGEAAAPWPSSDFSSSTFRAPLTSAIPAFPSLLAPGLLTVPFPPGTGCLDLLGGPRRSRSPLLPSSQGHPLDRSPSGLKGSQQLRPAALPLQPGSSGSRGGGGGGEALRAGLPPYIIRQLIIIEAARFNPLPAGRVRRAGAAPAAGTARRSRPPAPPTPAPAPTSSFFSCQQRRSTLGIGRPPLCPPCAQLSPGPPDTLSGKGATTTLPGFE